MHPLWIEYCTKSTLHGLHYVVEKGKPLVERIAWMLLMITGTIGITKQLIDSWNLLRNGPVEVIVQNPRYDLHNIDFPAITVCSFNKVNAVRANLIFERMFENNASEENKVAFLNSLMALSLSRFPFYNHGAVFRRNYANSTFYQFRNEDIKKIMEEVNPTISDIFVSCFWRGSEIKCDDLFRPQMTEEGFCYSFNSKTSVMGSISNSTPLGTDENGDWEVLRNNAAGKISALEMFMNFPKIEHRIPQDNFQPDGYSIMIHNPIDFPDTSGSIAVVKSSNEVYRIAVTVSITEGDISLSNLDEEVRACSYVENTHYKTTESFCLQQCRLADIFSHCNCLPYFMNDNDEIRTCGIQDLECLSFYNVNLRTSTAPKGVKGFPIWSMPAFMPCTCSRHCSYVTYDTELSITHSVGGNLANAYPKYFAYVDVFFKHPWAIRYSMRAQFGVSDFFVAIGGVAGLLLGCSMVSVIELLYFFGRYIYSIYLLKKPKLYPFLP